MDGAGEPDGSSFGSNAHRHAEAPGNGKWQYVREDMLLNLINGFFTHHVFGPDRIAHFQAQHADLTYDIDQRIALQLGAIEAGVDATIASQPSKPNANKPKPDSPPSRPANTKPARRTSMTPTKFPTRSPNSDTNSPTPTPTDTAASSRPSGSPSPSTATTTKYK
jgi:hypothetical protein